MNRFDKAESVLHAISAAGAVLPKFGWHHPDHAYGHAPRVYHRMAEEGVKPVGGVVFGGCEEVVGAGK